MIWKKKKYEDFVDISIGRVYIRPLTNGDYNKALNASVVKSVPFNAKLLDFCEKRMTQLYFWQWKTLTIRDGNILREKIIEMLTKDGIVSKSKKEEKDEAKLDSEISKEDLQWFQANYERQKGLVR